MFSYKYVPYFCFGLAFFRRTIGVDIPMRIAVFAYIMSFYLTNKFSFSWIIGTISKEEIIFDIWARENDC